MKVSVIVPTYNRPKALQLCLMSIGRQSTLPDEVLIADDGSGDETRLTIESFKTSSDCRFKLRHIWQEDIGFRKPMILNETVRNATGDYLIFIDGDCIAHRHFLQQHIRNAETNAMLGGKRVDLGQCLSEALLSSGKLMARVNFWLLWDSVVRDSRKVEEALLISSTLLRHLAKLDRIRNDGIWGCNFSVSRELFFAINGCDEDFLDGSIEDNDLGIRVLNRGGKLKSVRCMANVFHLWHKSTWSFSNEKYLHNRRKLDDRIANKESVCRNGIKKL